MFYVLFKACYRYPLFNLIGINTLSKDNSIKIFGHLTNAIASYIYVIHRYKSAYYLNL